MTREEAKVAANVMEAYANGKEIQYFNDDGEWITTRRPLFNWDKLKYRIKPEPKYRPFKTKEECWAEMHKHPDFGWVTDDYYKSTICVKSNSIVITISSYEYSFVKAFETHKFTDGTPFGVKED